MYELSKSSLPSGFQQKNHLPHAREVLEQLRVGEPGFRAVSALTNNPAMAATFATYAHAGDESGMAAVMMAAILSDEWARSYPIHLHHYVALGVNLGYRAVMGRELGYIAPKLTTAPLDWMGVRKGVLSYANGHVEVIELDAAHGGGGRFTQGGECHEFGPDGKLDGGDAAYIYPLQGS